MDKLTLGYNPNAELFNQTGIIIVECNHKHNFCHWYAIHDYYPKSRFSNVDHNIETVRNMVYQLKVGKTFSFKLASIFKKSISAQIMFFFNKNQDCNTILIPIPASTQDKTDNRFKELSHYLAEILKIEDGFNTIKVVDHPPLKGTTTDRIQYLKFENSLIKNKNVILMDDVITSGTTFYQISNELLKIGAMSVCGIFFAKTVGIEPIHSIKKIEA